MRTVKKPGKEIPYHAKRKRRYQKPDVISTFKKIGSIFSSSSNIDWEQTLKVLVVIGIFVGAGYVIYLLIVNYKTIDTKVTSVSWIDEWYSDTDCTTTMVGDTQVTTCDTDYYYKRSFKMDLENGMHIEFSDTKEVSLWDYKLNVPEMRTFTIGDCVRLGGYDCPWGGFSVMNVEKLLGCK
jgi:hypothetical protein